MEETIRGAHSARTWTHSRTGVEGITVGVTAAAARVTARAGGTAAGTA